MSTPPAQPPHSDVRSDYKIQKLMSTFLLNQNFACLIHYLHDYYIIIRTLPKIQYDHLQY